MGPPSLTLRCTHCGRYLVTPAPWSVGPAWFACPHCGQPVPVLGIRDPPPLFSWEVYPQLYPPLPAPRGPGRRLPLVALAALVALTVTLVSVAGLLVYGGAVSLSPGRFSVGGVVTDPNGSPIVGSTVRVFGSDGFERTLTTDGYGQFRVDAVPGGNVTVNATAAGFSSSVVEIFLSPTYTAADGGGTSLRLVLSPGTGGGGTTRIVTAFPDLESLVATLWSGAVVVAVAALVCALGTRAARTERSGPLAVAGGTAALLTPIAFIELGVTTVYPVLDWVAALLFSLGILVATLSVIPMVLTGAAPDP